MYTPLIAPKLSPDIVVATGVALVHRQGWSALSLRAVAQELQVTPMALYRHVGESKALSGSVVEAVIARCAQVISTGDASGDLATC